MDDEGGRDGVIGVERARMAALRRVVRSDDGVLVLGLLRDVFEVDLPCFQDKEGVGLVVQRGHVGEYDVMDAMRRDAQREVVVWLEVNGGVRGRGYGFNNDDDDEVMNSRYNKILKGVSGEKRAAAVEAGKSAAKGAWARSESRGLKWWERLVWVAVVGGAAAVCNLVGGCGVMDFNIRGADGGSLTVERDDAGRVVIVGNRPVQVQKGK